MGCLSDGNRVCDPPRAQHPLASTQNAAGASALSHPAELVSAFALLLLAQSPSHGYGLVERLRAFGFDWGGHGPLYAQLRSLETRGLVRSSYTEGDAGPLRRKYELTSAGRAALGVHAQNICALRQTLDSLFEARVEADGVVMGDDSANPGAASGQTAGSAGAHATDG